MAYEVTPTSGETARRQLKLSPKEYFDTAERQIVDVLGAMDARDMDLPLVFNIEDLYPRELRVAYALAGSKLDVPVMMALTFLLFTHSSNMVEFHSPPGWWSRLISDSAKRRFALLRAHTKVRNWLISTGQTTTWDHARYPSFLKVLAEEFESVLNKRSPADWARLSRQMWMSKTPDLSQWRQLAERALL